MLNTLLQKRIIEKKTLLFKDNILYKPYDRLFFTSNEWAGELQEKNILKIKNKLSNVNITFAIATYSAKLLMLQSLKALGIM